MHLIVSFFLQLVKSVGAFFFIIASGATIYRPCRARMTDTTTFTPRGLSISIRVLLLRVIETGVVMGIVFVLL